MSREAFEKWYAEAMGEPNVRRYADSKGVYTHLAMQSAWLGWQAAQAKASKPVAAVHGWFHGECVIRALDPEEVLPAGMALYSQPQAQAGGGEEEYGRGYYDGRKSNIDQVPEFWYEALEKIAQEYEELFIYYKDEREKDGWDSPEYPQTLLEVRELLKGFNPAPPAAVNQQLLEALKTFVKYNEEGAPLSFDTDGMWSKARAAIAAAQEQSK